MNVIVRSKAVRAFMVGIVVSSLIIVGCQDTNPAGAGANNEPSPLVSGIPSAQTSVPAKSWERLTIAPEQQKINKELIALSKAVAIALKSAETQKLLHLKVLEKFDGETEVLWSGLNNDRAMTSQANVSQALNWSGLEAKSVDRAVFSSVDAVNATVARAAKEYHANLHLYWFNAEKWDGKTTPIVTFVPVGCDPEKENVILTGYDANGKTFAVDREFALKNPVIVINANERTNADGSVKEGFISSSGGGNSFKDGKSVQSGSTLGLQWTQFYNESNEGWFNGNPEFWISIHSVNAAGPTYTTFEWGRWYCSYYWAECYGQIHIWNGARQAWWDQNQYKTLRFQWIEQDPGTTIELTFGASYKVDNTTITAGAKIITTDQSDILGAATINFDDPVRAYYTGAPNFGVSF
jgi:hypothetical protein